MPLFTNPNSHFPNVPVPTNIKFKDYLKAVKLIVAKKFDEFSYVSKSGSARRFELRSGEKITMWVVHEDRYIFSKDFKQTLSNLGVTEDEFRACF